ncbi:MAG: DUF4147 domain-containing protein [Candidatus Binataceae bacterium]|nr:DUF4147 domain-containing protein [Candidatus Binataceae bacterium]
MTTVQRRDLGRIYDAAVAAVKPEPLIAAALAGRIPGGESLPAKISQARRIFVIAAGKAAIPMAREIVTRCGFRIGGAIAAALQSKDADNIPGVTIFAGGHPLPDAGSIRAAEAAMDLARQAEQGDLLIVALSGGASAIMARPAHGITLDDKVAITNALMRAGASIRELNQVRKHLSSIKGGRLLAGTGEAEVLTLILSDVIGNDLATIGSGPTVADPSTYSDAVSILKRHRVWGRAPESVRSLLERGGAGELPETVKPGDPRLARSAALIIGDNSTAVAAAAREAALLGYAVRRWTDGFSQEAEIAARKSIDEIKQMTPGNCLIAGGEPLVNLRGQGRGGRAQHCALAIAVELERHGLGGIAALVAGTDGIDGPTDAAGAFVDSTTIARADRAAINPQASLQNNDSYTFFATIGDLLITGPSGTNAADLLIALAGDDRN